MLLQELYCGIDCICCPVSCHQNFPAPSDSGYSFSGGREIVGKVDFSRSVAFVGSVAVCIGGSNSDLARVGLRSR